MAFNTAFENMYSSNLQVEVPQNKKTEDEQIREKKIIFIVNAL